MPESSKAERRPAREYEARALNKPDPSVEIEVNGVKFDWYEGNTLLDAKHVGNPRQSFFDLRRQEPFIQEVAGKKIAAELQRQLNALSNSSFERIEWRVSDAQIAQALEKYVKNLPTFRPAFETGKIVITFTP